MYFAGGVFLIEGHLVEGSFLKKKALKTFVYPSKEATEMKAITWKPAASFKADKHYRM